MNIMDYKDIHKGGHATLVGTGPSLHDTLPYCVGTAEKRPIRIGVNDVERYTKVDYLVMVDPIHRFEGERRDAIVNSRAVRFIGQPYCGAYPVPTIDYYLQQPRGKTGLPNGNGEFLYYKDTPYIAMSLAYWMGISELGIIGVDHTGEHWTKGGHMRIGSVALDIRWKWDAQCKIFAEHGMRCFKLSWESLLPLPYVSYQEWVE